jgi:hypothetical protein
MLKAFSTERCPDQPFDNVVIRTDITIELKEAKGTIKEWLSIYLIYFYFCSVSNIHLLE